MFALRVRIPVWGFGDVVQSEQPEVVVGERLYGYFPMSSDVVLEPCRIAAAGFADGAAHRTALHAVYNQYQRCSVDPLYTQQTEDAQALLRPLFTTAWLLDDFLADNAFFGARQSAPGEPGAIILSSASSKTASATAWGLRQRTGIEVTGLTSASNQSYCENLGCYQRVLRYDQLDALASDRPCVYVDFAGNAELRMRIHTRFSGLGYSCSIGATHVEAIGGGKHLPGPPATLFFAPDQVRKRAAEWGTEEFGKRMLAAWRAFLAVATDPQKPWIRVQHHHGPDQVNAAYQQVLSGKGAAINGHMLALQ